MARRRLACGAAALTCAAAVAQPAPELGAAWIVAPPPRVHGDAGVDALDTRVAVTLAQLSAYALVHNPATRAYWEAALVDVAGIDAARALQWPTVSGTLPLSATRNVGGTPSTSDGATDPAPIQGWTRTAGASVSLTWILFDFGARSAGVEAARWQAVASALSYNRALQTVVSEVEQAYFNERAALALVEALDVNRAAAQASLDAARALREAGLATVGDVAQANAAVAAASLQQVQAKASERSDAGALAAAVGISVNTPLRLARDDADVSSAAARLADVDQLIAQAHLSRADLRSLDAQVAQAEAQRVAARAQGLPSLSFSAASGRSWSSQDGPALSQQATITLSIPIFDGGLVRAQTVAARERARQIAALRDTQQASVDLQVWQAFQTASAAQAAIDAAGQALDSSVVAEANASARYRAGMGTLLELLVTQNNVAQARVALVQARYSASLSYANLGYAVGARHLPERPRQDPVP